MKNQIIKDQIFSRRGVIVIGASGSGKSLVVELLQNCSSVFRFFPKHTTRRQRRSSEVEGVHYHFVDPETFRCLESDGSFVHLKQSDYDCSCYAISRNVLDSILKEGKIPCFTAHSLEEAVEVQWILRPFGLQLVMIYVYCPEEKRVKFLIDSDQRHKLLSRYHSDIGFKLSARQKSFDGCDFVLFNGDNRAELEDTLRSISAWIISMSGEKPAMLRPEALIRIDKDIQQIKATIESALRLENQDTKIAVKDAILAEHQTLREEIKQYHSERNTHVNFAIGVTLGILAGLGSKDPSSQYRAFLLALAPYIYAILASLYLDRSLRVVRIADYIENDMRPRMEQLLDVTVWQWERYKRETKVFPRWIAKWLDRLRILVFIVPAMACFTAWFLAFRHSAGNLEQSLAFAGVFVILLVILVNHLTQETSGAVLKVSQKERSGDGKSDG